VPSQVSVDLFCDPSRLVDDLAPGGRAKSLAVLGWEQREGEAMTDETTVTRNDEASRYEIHLGDTLAGFARYQRRPDEIRFVHTEVDPAFQGKGLAGILASGALADAAASGDTIVPYCPYIAGYLKKHDVAGAKIRWPQLPTDPTDAASAG